MLNTVIINVCFNIVLKMCRIYWVVVFILVLFGLQGQCDLWYGVMDKKVWEPLVYTYLLLKITNCGSDRCGRTICQVVARLLPWRPMSDFRAVLVVFIVHLLTLGQDFSPVTSILLGQLIVNWCPPPLFIHYLGEWVMSLLQSAVLCHENQK